VIGIDFDNTSVCYDDVFGRVAVEQGLVTPEAATSKTAIRDHLRSLGQEDRWTELQGTIYGPRMMDARDELIESRFQRPVPTGEIRIIGFWY